MVRPMTGPRLRLVGRFFAGDPWQGSLAGCHVPMAMIWLASILALAIGLVGSAGASEATGTPIGRQVESFSLPDVHGKPHALRDYQGKVVVLVFLGTECPLARKYAPRLHDLAGEFAAKDVAFLGIDANLQDSLTEMGAFAR